MFRIAIALVVLSGSPAAGLRAGVWAPPDLHVVSAILNTMLHKHMAPENRKFAEQVAQEVKADIAALVNGTNLTRQEQRAKAGAAIKAMESLREKLESTTPQNGTSSNLKLEEEQKELVEKKEELEKEMKELKVMKLKKQLLEKKLKLSKLMAEKGEAAESKKSMAAEAKAQHELLAKLGQAAAGMAKGGKANATSSLLASLTARSKELNETISKMDAEDKQQGAKLASLADKQPPAKKEDPLSKGQAMLKGLRKEEHRAYEKARAVEKAQLAEIDSTIQSISKGDVHGLQQTLGKMKAEEKAIDAKTGSFLY